LENNASEDGHNSKERNRKYHETIHKEKQLREFSCHIEQILAYANGQSNLNAQAIWPYHLTSFVMHKCHRNILEKMKKAGYENTFPQSKGPTLCLMDNKGNALFSVRLLLLLT
jgi:hypothetical protein